MQILEKKAFSSRQIYYLLPIVICAIILSGWLAGYRTPSKAAYAEDYFSAGVYRTGASTDRLVSSLQTRLREHPEDWQAYSQLGMAYLQKARETGDPSFYQKAEAALGEALSRQPDDYASISSMGALALARHQFQAALEWGERALAINPSRSYAYGVLADAQIELGLYEEAVLTLQKMVDLRPDMSAFARISYLRELHGDTEGALEMMQMAVDSGVPLNETAAWTRTQLGHLYFNRGKLEKAEIEYRRTLLDYPGYVYALAGLGRVRAAGGQVDEAISYLTQAIETVPLPEFVILLADVYQVSGQVEAAREQHDLLGVIRKLYEANGVDMDMEIALFNADHDLDLESTLLKAREAFERRPGVHGADVLAWTYYKSGQYEEARFYSDQALRLGSQDALMLFHSGMIHYRLGDRDQAQVDLERALAINPHFSILHVVVAQRILDELKSTSPGN